MRLDVRSTTYSDKRAMQLRKRANERDNGLSEVVRQASESIIELGSLASTDRQTTSGICRSTECSAFAA